MKTKIIQLLFVFTLLSSAAFAQSNSLSHWYPSAYAEARELSIFSSIKMINWFYSNNATTDDILANTWPVLNASQMGYNFADTQDYTDYVYSSGVSAIELYFIEQANVYIGSNTVKDAIDADHPLLAYHYDSYGGVYVTITGYDASGYTYWDPVTASSAYDTFINFGSAKEITGVK